MRVDFLILADSAQVAGDKLYMLGGGWHFIRAQSFPVNHQMALAAGLLVDWNETNTRHTFKLEVKNEDTQKVLFAAEGEFEQGRPPGAPPGMEQRVMFAFNTAPRFDGPGSYVALLRIDGQQLARTPFMVRGVGQRFAGSTAPPADPS